MIICCVLDRKVGFDGIQVFTNEEVAKRVFMYSMKQSGIPNFSPSDFEFYKVGEFDQKSGQITSCLPELLISGLDCVGE